MDILTTHKDFLNRVSNKYSYLGKEDIYNQLVCYLIEAYSSTDIENKESYALARLRNLVRKEKREKVINYGLTINKSIEQTEPSIGLDTILDKLKDKTQRSILDLYYNYGFNQVEIADSLGISQQYVSFLHKKALSILNKKARTL